MSDSPAEAAESPLADTPSPPYVAVVFSATRTGVDLAGYAAAGIKLLELARQQPGFLGVESVSDASGCELTVSYWENAAAAHAWRQHPEHLPLQQLGRERWYSQYRLRVGRVTRQTSFDGADVETTNPSADFAALVQSRKTWIDEELRGWCRQARRRDLLLAEQEWLDIAGKVDPEKTLWAWAWSRFPALVHEDLGIDESSAVSIDLHNGGSATGYPDARRSQHGFLMLYGLLETGSRGDLGPYSIDEVRTARRMPEQ